MKKIFSFALMACALLLNTACSDENVESRTPVASIQYDTNKTTLKVNESLVIDFTGVADLVAIYPGDNGHRYEKRDEMETGIAVNKTISPIRIRRRAPIMWCVWPLHSTLIWVAT